MCGINWNVFANEISFGINAVSVAAVAYCNLNIHYKARVKPPNNNCDRNFLYRLFLAPAGTRYDFKQKFIV